MIWKINCNTTHAVSSNCPLMSSTNQLVLPLRHLLKSGVFEANPLKSNALMVILQKHYGFVSTDSITYNFLKSEKVTGTTKLQNHM
jgi:hypothetical protein